MCKICTYCTGWQNLSGRFLQPGRHHISVGYRVKSLQGTRFRQWATRLLREHLTRYYTLDARRLAEEGLTEVREAVALLAQTLDQHALVSDEGAAVLAVVQRYLGSFSLLLAYDEDRLPNQPTGPKSPQALSLVDAHAAIESLRGALVSKGEATALFARERGTELTGILAPVEQTMVRRAALSQCAGTTCAYSVFHHQGPPFRRWQQAHRHFAVSGISATQRPVVPGKW